MSVNNNKTKYKNRLIAIEALSIDGAKFIQDFSLDLVFIDADHSYPWVKSDIQTFSKKIKPGGWLTGHDIDFPGVFQAVNECIKNFDVATNNVWLTKV